MLVLCPCSKKINLYLHSFVFFYPGLLYAVVLLHVTFPFRNKVIGHLHVAIQVRIRRAPVPIHTWMFVRVLHLTVGGGCPALEGRRPLAVAICRGLRSSAGRSGQAGGDAPGRLFHPWAAGRRQLKGLGCDFSVGGVLKIPSCAWPGSALLGRVSLPFCCRWAHGTWARAALLWVVKSLVLTLWLFRTCVLPIKLMPLSAARSRAGPSEPSLRSGTGHGRRGAR